MPTIHDDEFGTIVVRRSAKATQVRLRVGPDGALKASMPVYAPLFLLKRLIKTSRGQLRAMIEQARPVSSYTNGQQIGKSHTLLVQPGSRLTVARQKQHIVVTLPASKQLFDPAVTKKIREVVIQALRIEAKSYLPKRLAYVAAQYGMSYEKVRFSHASSRWGSCSSTGTISLNIALMKLPFELIDYVIMHELAHTRHLNHSEQFWQLVASMDADYKKHRKLLKAEAPSI